MTRPPFRQIWRTTLAAAALASAAAHAADASARTAAERLLTERNAEFEQGVIEVAPGVYTAVGFGVSPSSMIVGETGIVIVDAQIDAPAARGALAAFREITELPVAAILLTHGHPDHTGGVSVFAAGGMPEIWAGPDFGHEARWGTEAGLTVQRLRGVRQAGRLLPPAQRINNGVARAYRPEFRGPASRPGVTPTHFVTEPRRRIDVAGIRLDLVAAPGETSDQLFVWYPEGEVLFAGDNFYKSWPNLYAIRGTAYRDVQAWAASLDAMLAENPAHLVGGHTRPVLGRERVREVLTNYRDGIRSIFEQTIAGMNRGLTPDELVEVVALPPELADLDYLRPYYGNAAWAVRSIFDGYLGWFDGNPTSLFPLSPAEEASRVADLAGGVDVLRERAAAALATDPQWTAELCDRLLALDPGDTDAMELKADALEALARPLLTTTGRNYYLTVAMQLRARARGRRRGRRDETALDLRTGRAGAVPVPDRRHAGVARTPRAAARGSRQPRHGRVRRAPGRYARPRSRRRF